MAAGITQHISRVSTNNCSQAAVGTFNAPVYFGSIENHNDVLSSLPYAIDAPFNAYQRQHDPTCLPDTRVDLLKEIYDWADGRGGGGGERSIFWLSGRAGSGKSTIARTVARRYLEMARLGASFFFTRNGGDVGHAGKFVTSIARQLASNIPSLEQHIYTAVKERRDIVSQSLVDQWQQLVLRPLSRLNNSNNGNNGNNGDPYSYVLVVDALDECDNDDDIRMIINFLATASSSSSSSSWIRLRIFLTSRPQIPIRQEFHHQIPDAAYQDFVLDKIPPSIVDHDMCIFFRHNLELIRQKHCLQAGWPNEETIGLLIQIVGGLFSWASTACRYIDKGNRVADRRLRAILRSSTQDIHGLGNDNSVSFDWSASSYLRKIGQ